MAADSSNPSNINEPDRAYLLWRTFQRFREFREEQYRLSKETTVRTFKNNPTDFLESPQDRFVKSCLNLLPVSQVGEKEKLIRLLVKVYESYKKEIVYLTNRSGQFSMDILFSVIETVFMEFGTGKAESAVMDMATQKSSVTKQDLEEILGYLKAYNKMQARFLACGSMKKAIEMSDEIIMSGAAENMQIPIMALDAMFNLITSQYVLSQKYNCKQLLLGWKKEYGFSDEETRRIAALFPLDSSLLEFRNHYAKALQTIQARVKSGEPGAEMDIFLIRTISNYYTSWINQVASQLHKKEVNP